MAVTSHVDGTLATAVFDNVAVDQGVMTSSMDVGNGGVAGSTTFDGVVYEVKGSGADIQGIAEHSISCTGPSAPSSAGKARSIAETIGRV